MKISRAMIPGTPPGVNLPERRKKQRIYTPFPALVEGVDLCGKNFRINTVLDNLSVDGLFLRMVARVKEGDHLSVVFTLSTDMDGSYEGQRVRVEGVVIRVEEKIGGAYGIAVLLEPARFI